MQQKIVNPKIYACCIHTIYSIPYYARIGRISSSYAIVDFEYFVDPIEEIIKKTFRVNKKRIQILKIFARIFYELLLCTFYYVICLFISHFHFAHSSSLPFQLDIYHVICIITISSR